MTRPSHKFASVCVFCGSNLGVDPAFAEEARVLGKLLAGRGMTLVYGGGKTGLMGTVADEALRNGGRVIGVIPRAMVDKEVAHHGVTELRIVSSMHERKAMMAQAADAFVALPGGFGTLEELFEVITWGQLGIHAKPVGLLNVSNFYGDLLRFVDHAAERGLIKARHRELLIEDSRAENLLARMETHAPPRLDKWIKKDQT